MKIEIKHYSELSRDELYDLLQQRQHVFIIEQASIYDDLDAYDKDAYHLLCYKDDKLAASSRILSAGTKLRFASIGRIACAKALRGEGLGRKVIEASIQFIEKTFNENTIQISAQQHLEAYYNSFGFIKCSEPYDDGGIDHIDMKRST